MKQILFTFITLVFMSCGDGTVYKGNVEPTAQKTNSLSDNPDYQKGLTLVANSDCLTCHKVGEKLIGPAYKDVADKYENTDANIKMLSLKVIKGGAGNWGQIPMTPHPQLKQEDVEQMIKYILLLKK